MKDNGIMPSHPLTQLASQITSYEGRFIHPDRSRDKKTVKAMADKHFAAGEPPAVIPEYEDAYHAVCTYFNFQEVAALSQFAAALAAKDIQRYAVSTSSSASISYVADHMVAILGNILEDKNRLKALYEAHRVPVATRKQEASGTDAGEQPQRKAALLHQALMNVTGGFINAPRLHKHFPAGIDGKAVGHLLAKEESVLRQEYGNDDILWDTCIRLCQAAQKFTETAETITGIRR